MSQEEKQKAFTARVEDLVAYCRANFKISWQPQLKGDEKGILPIIMYFDHEKSNEIEAKEVDSSGDKEAGSAPQSAESTDGQEDTSEKAD